MPTFDAFISYAREDVGTARRLYADLRRARAKVFLDEENLLGGQRWKAALRTAIRDSEYFIALLSSSSVQKRGYVQKELREALEVQSERPENEIFVIPVRLDNCRPSHPALEELNWIDLFPDYDVGLARVLRSMQLEPDEALEVSAASKEAPRSITPTAPVVTSGSLAIALDTRAAPEEAALQLRLNLLSASSALSAQVVRNLFIDPNLTRQSAEALLDALLVVEPTVESVRAALVGVARGEVLAGPPAAVPAGTMLGALLPLDTLASQLVESAAARTMAQARKLARSVLDGKNPGLAQILTFGRHVTWATFNPVGGSPFNYDWTVDYLLCILGRPRQLAGETLVTAEYRLPESIVPRVPTSFDAYAGTGWHYYFRPTSSGDRYGKTLPWDECANDPPRPEVVHEPLPIAALSKVRFWRKGAT